jgi:hypothetical protein
MSIISIPPCKKKPFREKGGQVQPASENAAPDSVCPAKSRMFYILYNYYGNLSKGYAKKRHVLAKNPPKIKKEILYSYSIFFKRPTGIAKISFKRTGMGTETGNKMPGMV